MKNSSMRRSATALFFTILISFSALAQVPTTWHTTGIGGGGALFSPSINPGNTNEYYAACDMSELFHTTDFGLSYDIVDFRQLQSFHNSKVVFTNNTNIRYCINYANNMVVPVKTTDGGATWLTLAGNPDNTSETFSIWADYNNPNRVIISYYGIVYFSTNGGTTFTNIHNAISSGSGVVVGGVFFDGNNIYIGTNDGILESTNGGTSFTTLATTGIPATEGIGSFAAARQGGTLRFFCVTGSTNNLYAGQLGSDYWGFLKGVYSMDNNSGTWTSRMNGITLNSDYLMYVAMAENDITTAYLAGATSSQYPNVMKTSDGGLTWVHVFNTTTNQNITTGWCGSGGDHAYSWPECTFGLAVAATNKDFVIFTDYSDVMKTSNGGTLWQQAYVNTADQHPAGAATPVKQYYHSAGLENTASWYLDWSTANDLFASFTDIFAIRSKDGGSSWAFDYTGPTTNTIYCTVKNNAGTTLFAATSSVHDLYKSYRLQDNIIDASNTVGKIIFSTDKGATWTQLHDFAHPVYWLATDPNNPDRMYAAVVNHTQGLGGVWVTNNLSAGAASTWTQLAAPPRTEGHPASMKVLNNGKLLCSFSGRRDVSGVFTNSSGVFLYDPVAASWTDKSDAGQHYWCRDVVVDPIAPQTTWYCGVYSGWGGAPNGLGGLYKTSDGGSSWTRIFNGGDVSSFTFNPANPNELFVCTHGNGLWYSVNINQATPNFIQVPGYTFGVPERVFFNPYDQNKMWVCSFGHGLQWGDLGASGIASEENSNTEINIYPNPASEEISLDFSPGHSLLKEEINDLIILDLLGQKVNDFKLRVSGGSVKIDIQKLPPGMYLVEMRYGQKVYPGKFIKE